MSSQPAYLKSLPQDLIAGVVVFLIALPLCLGVAIASGAPPLSGIISGIVGGMLVVWISGSHTSVSGPAAGLTAIVAAQIATLGSFEALLLAVILAGVLQIGLALLKAGSLAAFFPSSVIKGLLAAIGIILILKQVPHLFGYDAGWLGDLNFNHLNGSNTLSVLYQTLFQVSLGPALIGLLSIALLVSWNKTPLAQTRLPAPLAVVMIGIGLAEFGNTLGGPFTIEARHLVQVPVTESLAAFMGQLRFPDFSSITNPAIAIAAVTIALVASLETLLNLEAVDKLDPQRRLSPPNRELVAQGVGNITCGFLGGLPVTSVVVRSSVGINAGAKTRVACFVHGVLLLLVTLFLPGALNRIPMACLAAILMMTGLKLASPKLIGQLWREGRSQFVPFVITIIAIVLTDLLTGILIGLAAASVFILQGNLRHPLRKTIEPHIAGAVTRIELAQHVSFLNRAALRASLYTLEDGTSVVIDARNSIYIDPDIGDLIEEFALEHAPAHDLTVSRVGFKAHYDIEDHIAYPEITTRALQASATPAMILQRMKAGNARYVAGELSLRDHRSQVRQASGRQHPLAVVLACMDARVHADMVFGLGAGDLFSVRIAGNIVSRETLGSIEYACRVAGAKVILVLGHSRCDTIASVIDQLAGKAQEAGSLQDGHQQFIAAAIGQSIRTETATEADRHSGNEAFVGRVMRLNVLQSLRDIRQNSSVSLRKQLDDGSVLLLGASYDVESGAVEFIPVSSSPAIGC